ncbi:2-phospho-L-lactate transferase [Hydrogenophaga sp.]|uniref:2-phospho-L-lactate transferase n=1 Tax=Hydrogenophaga sp. TaxID=1904254 RepID=UPI00271C718F|nr:2-phospho-L-lactate transferase [Hydrogenophaga sp.]MDO9433944.1 2-phospho-L-lactate transferase [Hydrogenophaga sp.]
MVLTLAGGVGGAKMARGLADLLSPDELVIAVNTGDDFLHCGLHISPDLDTVMYTLAGRANPNTGWGLAHESWRTHAALGRLGGPAWFRLGDDDLATHLRRTDLLQAGASLTQATRQLCEAYGVAHAIVPMSDAPAATRVHTVEGELAFQDYFVRRRCDPAVVRIEHVAAPMSEALAQALVSPRLQGIVICPSNPWLSIAPLLAMPGMREALIGAKVPVVVVSPIIGGAAVKGPTAKIMRELGLESSSLEIAKFYATLADGIAIDDADASLAEAIAALGLRVLTGPTLMTNAASRQRLARSVLDFIGTLA